MNITNQFHQIGVFLTEDGLVPVIKKVPATSIPAVETHGITGQKLSHNGCNRSISGSKQKMQVLESNAQA